jgi:hypothetical protein
MKKFSSPFTLIKSSFEIFTKKENFIYLIQIYLPVGLLSVFSWLASRVPLLSNFFQSSLGSGIILILDILFMLIVILVNLAGIIAIARVLDNKRIGVGQTFSEAFSKYKRFFLFTVISYLIYLVSLILLIVPFILATTWFAFGRFLIVEGKMGVKESLLESKKLVKGYFWKIFIRLVVFALFSFILQSMLLFIPFGIGTVIFDLCGAFFLLPAFLLYKEVSSEKTING